MSIDKVQIQRARQTDLAEYLLSVGVPLKRNGHRHTHVDHDSLVFTKNSYYWNSRQDKGNAVDYLMRHMGLSFADAVGALTGFVPCANPATQRLIFDGLEVSKDNRRAIAYLHKTRGIDYGIIKELINRKLIMQEEKTNNIIFPMCDENGGCVGAELQGTLSEKRFKGVAAGSKYGYGFNVCFPGSRREELLYAIFFESAVDLISFIDIKRNHENKSLDGCLLVSMVGLKSNIIEHVLRVFGGKLKPVLCVDNDEAGSEFMLSIKRLNIAHKIHLPTDSKDWNEMLKSIRKQG